jgi:hypothetical protein
LHQELLRSAWRSASAGRSIERTARPPVSPTSIAGRKARHGNRATRGSSHANGIAHVTHHGKRAGLNRRGESHRGSPLLVFEVRPDFTTSTMTSTTRNVPDRSGSSLLRTVWSVPTSLEFVPDGAILVDVQDPAERQPRPRARRAGGLRGAAVGWTAQLAATARLSEVATPHRFCAWVMILVSGPGGGRNGIDPSG